MSADVKTPHEWAVWALERHLGYLPSTADFRLGADGRPGLGQCVEEAVKKAVREALREARK